MQARAEYMRLADTLWRSVADEGSSPAPAARPRDLRTSGVRLMSDYAATRDRVEDYFDRTATKVWERLTSDAPVSRIRQTVREGRDRMRAAMLSRLPADLRGARVLDAGCGAGQMTAELAARGADGDRRRHLARSWSRSPRTRLPAEHREPRPLRRAATCWPPPWGASTHVVAMDSLIYYRATDIAPRSGRPGRAHRRGVVFTVAPRTPFLMAFWTLGKLFPRADRSPIMVPHAFDRLARATGRPADPGRARLARLLHLGMSGVPAMIIRRKHVKKLSLPLAALRRCGLGGAAAWASFCGCRCSRSRSAWRPVLLLGTLNRVMIVELARSRHRRGPDDRAAGAGRRRSARSSASGPTPTARPSAGSACPTSGSARSGRWAGSRSCPSR